MPSISILQVGRDNPVLAVQLKSQAAFPRCGSIRDTAKERIIDVTNGHIVTLTLTQWRHKIS